MLDQKKIALKERAYVLGLKYKWIVGSHAFKHASNEQLRTGCTLACLRLQMQTTKEKTSRTWRLEEQLPLPWRPNLQVGSLIQFDYQLLTFPSSASIALLCFIRDSSPHFEPINPVRFTLSLSLFTTPFTCFPYRCSAKSFLR